MRGKGRPWNDVLYIPSAGVCIACVSSMVWLLLRVEHEAGFLYRNVHGSTYPLAVGLLAGIAVAVPLNSFWSKCVGTEEQGGRILGSRAFGSLFIVMGFLHIGVAWFSYDHFIQIDQSEIRVSDWWEIGSRKVPVSNVQRAVVYKRLRAPNGRVVERPHVVLELRDGDRIDTHYLLRENYGDFLDVLSRVRRNLVIASGDLNPGA